MRSSALILIVVTFAGCATPSVEQFSWLAGTWSSTEDGVLTSESWSVPNGDWMVGMNVSMRTGNDVDIYSEFLRIDADSSGITYRAQPDLTKQAVPFYLVESGDGFAVFENLDHDFPQRIHYRRDGDTLHARIEGTVRGEPRSSEWVWSREQDEQN